MKIKWLGHSCFVLTAADGTRILTDPYDETVGYPPLKAEADIVTVSHHHFDHDHTSSVKGRFISIDKPGRQTAGGIDINGIETFHDEVRGAKRGKNIIFTFVVDGLNICHCGDLGHLLTDEQIREIGKVDILFLPMAGTFTIDTDEACSVMKQLDPVITIPMHYKNEFCNFKVKTVDEFIRTAGYGTYYEKQEIEITSDSLNEFPRILVLKYMK